MFIAAVHCWGSVSCPEIAALYSLVAAGHCCGSVRCPEIAFFIQAMNLHQALKTLENDGSTEGARTASC